MKEIKFDGKTITKGYCSTLQTKIVLKEFPLLIVSEITDFFADTVPTGDKDNSRTKNQKVGLTEDEILRWFNEAESFEYRNGELVIYTEKYTFFVEVNKK